jgi:hypothetical protein
MVMEKHCKFCGVLIEGYSRITKKYCSDNCKQLAFYARQGKHWGAAAIPGQTNFTLNGKQENEIQIAEPISLVNAIEQEKETVPSALSVKLEEKQVPVKSEPVRSYRWVNSPLLDAIQKYREESDAEYMLNNAGRYWTPDALQVVSWLTIRFRCLLENILRLSNYKTIDQNTLHEITRAFTDLTSSCYFGATTYPFSNLILELRDKFNAMAKQAQGDEITLRLSLYRKVELMAVRFMIGNTVPKMSFSQLKFGDGIREEVEKQFRNNGKEKSQTN